VAYRPVAKQSFYKQRPLLCNARNIHAINIRRTVFSVVRKGTASGQQHGKHVPAVTDTKATIEERCFLCSPCRDVITRTDGTMTSVELVEFCTGGCEDRTQAREHEESPLLEAVTRERLMKTKVARKRIRE
jgi:hypothetical protein